MSSITGKSGRTYWRSLQELAGTPAMQQQLARALPAQADQGAIDVSRRELLSIMAASLALGGLTACTQQPAEFIAPYVRRPENLTPGNARWYASTLPLDGYGRGVLVKTVEGRPVKIEGNPEHPASLGATDCIAQAELLGLYDPDRSQIAHYRGVAAGMATFIDRLDAERTRWRNGEAALTLLSGAITSPSQLALIEALRTRYPEFRWYSHEPLSRQAVYAGTKLAFGKALEPRYRFEQANVILNLDADSFGDGPAKLVHARQAMTRRGDLSDGGHHNRIYTLESSPTITGAASDHRLALSAAEVLPFSLALAARLGVQGARAGTLAALPGRWLDAVADDLKGAGRNALVIPGDAQPASVHALAHAINATLDAVGTTVTYAAPVRGIADGNLADLVTRMGAGGVEALLMLDVNPVYDSPPTLHFAAALERVPFSVHWGQYRDETAHRALWHIPATHPLESWDDARAVDGTASIMQPTIMPLYDGLTAQQLLAAFDGRYETDARELVRACWRRHFADDDFERQWRAALQNGTIPATAAIPGTPELEPSFANGIAAPPLTPGLELQWRPDPALHDGRYANNGWLHELPRPITRLTWDSAALISPQLAAAQGLADGQVVNLMLAGRHLAIPVRIQPGQPADSVTLHVGQGRRHAGRVGDGVGVNAFSLLPASGALHAGGLELAVTDRHVALADTQQHNTMDGQDLIRETTLGQRKTVRREARNDPRESLYPARDYKEHAWGMSINLSSCIGCNACITACQAENNIPVVGKDEVLHGREMHWLRVDRYYAGSAAAPDIRFQPVPCMHCEKAPCEYVCPVGATQHSSEGLNDMIYNRCVGTRYCSQNCPYKVRRFNWYHYTDDARSLATPAAAHNPDVTVRSRGVMEKCTYCVQRINQAHVNARNDDREIADGEVRTACQQACPVSAITFGDINDPDSAVARAKASPLDYALLGELNTRPRTTYLTAIRNPNPVLGNDETTERDT